MIPAEINVTFDREAVRNYLNQQLAAEVQEHLKYADLKKLSSVLCMSERFIESEFLRDPRVRVHERRKSRKRWWDYKPTIEAIQAIVDEWD